MNKPAGLRGAIVAAVPALAENPDRLTVFIDQGTIAATNAKSPSFEYRYTCNVLLLDFTGDSDALFIAIVEWVRTYQADLFLNFDERGNGISYEVDILGNDSADVSIRIPLTESVVVAVADDGTRTVTHVDDSAARPDSFMWGAEPWPT